MSSRREREMARHNLITGLIIFAALVIFVIIMVISIKKNYKPPVKEDTEASSETVYDKSELEAQRVNAVIERARLYEKGYDYDMAIKYIEDDEAYKKTYELLIEVERLEQEKKKMVKWEDVRLIPHVYVNNLIGDSDRALSSPDKDEYLKKTITTDEFERVLEQLYDNDFVLVSIHDVASVKTIEKESGSITKFVWGDIELPEGKKPFVLSEENTSYSLAKGKYGFATKLVLMEDGSFSCEMDDGSTITYGDFDLVPILEKFIKLHPDFSYRGARAILGVSGSDGILGYKTSPKYDGVYDTAKEAVDAKNVADKLRELGYEMACNGYNYTGMSANSMDENTLVREMSAWKEEVSGIVGKTDILIFPNGEDIGDWHYYSGERFEKLKEMGYDYFINMNSSESCWNQIRDAYMRQGRRCISGAALADSLESGFFSDMLDASKILSEKRQALQ